MALRAVCKLSYPLEDEYFYDRGLHSTILDTIELPLLLEDPDEIDWDTHEKLSNFVGLIEGINSFENLEEFMREQQEMLLEAREGYAKRMGKSVQEASEYRAKMRKIIDESGGEFQM